MISTVYKKKNSTRRGLTLIELLIVSAIMLTLMAVSVPVLTPVTEGRVARETARGVQSALESARARAIRLGRPCGVALAPFHQNYKYGCITMEQLTAPPSYIENSPTLRRGDTVQRNAIGPRLLGTGTTINAGFGELYDYTGFGNDVNDWVVHRFPVPESGNAFAKAMGVETSYMLPKGYIVDLYYSGTGASDNWSDKISNTKYPPTIIFNPDGTAQLYLNGVFQAGVDAPNGGFLDHLYASKIFLLVGSWDRMLDSNGNSLADEGDIQINIKSYDSFWVVVNTRTGAVTYARNDPDNECRGLANNLSNARGGN